MSEEGNTVEENQTSSENKLSFASLKKNLEEVADQIFKPQRVDLQTPPSRLSLSLILLGIVVYVADIVSDLYLAFQYLNNGQILYFKLTLTFVLLPFAVVLIIQLTTSISNGDWKKPYFVILPFIILFVPVIMEASPFFHGLKSRRAGCSTQACQKYQTKMIEESALGSLIKLVETFLESAPQATLQTYILIVQQHENGQGPSARQLISLGLSLLGLAWSLASHNRRMLAAHKQPFTVAYIGSFLESLGYFLLISMERKLDIILMQSLKIQASLFLIVSRCFAMAAFASVHSLHHVIICTLIYLVLMWIFVLASQKGRSWGSSRTEILQTACFGGVFAWMFCYVLFNLVQSYLISFKKTFIVFYYLFMFILNSFALLLWMDSVYESESSGDQVNLAILKVVFNFVFFFLGLACLVLYNVKYHPSNIPDNSTVPENLPVQQDC